MSKLVLIAEDELLTQRLAASVAEFAGYSTQLANNGRECLDLINGGLKPDLILLDLEMPIMNGIQVLESLKGSVLKERCPIAVFTAKNQESHVLEAIRLGADDYIVKPFNPRELASRISDLIFEIDETHLLSLLGRLHIKDPNLKEVPSLKSQAGKDYEYYPISDSDKHFCVAVSAGYSTANITKQKMSDIVMNVVIFRKCAFGWRKVWPGLEDFAKASRGAG